MYVSSIPSFRLYSIAGFPVYLEQIEVHNTVVRGVRNMFQNMSTRNVIRSSLYVRNLNLQNYIFGNQHDAQECLAHTLDRFCPDVNNNMFQMIIKELIVGEYIPGSNDTGCSKRIEKDVTSKV